jgi:hypothetical protein
LKNPLFDEKVLDYRRKYEEACGKMQELENQLLEANEKFIIQNEDKQKRVQELLT